MKDYCAYDYERKDFITKYEVLDETNEIKIYYADNETYTIPYTIYGEIRLLNRMRKQVEDYPDFVVNTKQNRNLLMIKQIIYLLASAVFMVFLSDGVIGLIKLGGEGAILIPGIVMTGASILAAKKRFDKIGDKIDLINADITDYDKSMFYISNEKVFTNERLLRRDVKSVVPTRVKYILDSNVKDEMIPTLNLNNIDELTMKELKKTYEASLQSRGPELVIKHKK